MIKTFLFKADTKDWCPCFGNNGSCQLSEEWVNKDQTLIKGCESNGDLDNRPEWCKLEEVSE